MRRQIRILRARSSPGRLAENTSNQGLPFRVLPPRCFAGTLVITGAHATPTLTRHRLLSVAARTAIHFAFIEQGGSSLYPKSAPGHNALACATLLFKNNHAIARKEFDVALELNPSYVLARCWYSLLYFQWTRGEYDQGIAEARRALDIDPLSAYAAMNLAGCLCTAGLLEQGIETACLSVQLDPESFVARWMLGVSLGMAGGFNEAVSTLEAAAGMSGRHTLALTCLAGVFGQCGKGSEAGALHRELLDRAVRGYIPAAHLAISAEASGQREEAITFARRAWDEREPPFTLWARHFPQYRTLRSDPRFAGILREMDSPEGNEAGQS